MSPVAIALLVAVAVLVIAAEWPRVASRFGPVRVSKPPRPRRRQPRRRKSNLRVVHPDSEEFARAVERDLASLPTIDERDAKRH